MLRTSIAFMALSFFCSNVNALTVIHDAGGVAMPEIVDHPIDKTITQLKPKTLAETRYPVITETLTPGTVEKRKHNGKGISLPICVIGEDNLSVRWLESYAAQLVKLRAVCWVINVSTRENLAALAFIAEGKVPMIPMQGDAIKDVYGLTHYPALLSSQWIEQ